MVNEKHLLLVDDEDNITRSIRRLCRNRDYSVHTASSADEALDILSDKTMHVVLSDQLMPGKTGAELFSQMQALYPDTVRILLTGYTALEGITKAVNEGKVFRILFKPWDDEHLINSLDAAFEYHHIRQHNEHLAQELLDLNRNLEQRVEEKTRELSLHVRRLQVSQSLFELFPDVALGISDDMYIMQANRKAREVFGSQALVGLSTRKAFPEALQKLLDDAAHDKLVGPSTLSLANHRISVEVIRAEVSRQHSGYLLFGRIQ